MADLERCVICGCAGSFRPASPAALILVDGVETVVVLIAFRRFAQFPGNEHQRAHSGEEKGCGYDHDQTLAGSAPLSIFPTTFVLPRYDSAFF